MMNKDVFIFYSSLNHSLSVCQYLEMSFSIYKVLFMSLYKDRAVDGWLAC